jgi:small subunit ribosomal protein S7
MSRRSFNKKSFPKTDSEFNSPLVSLLTVRLLRRGKKKLAQKIIRDAFAIIEKRSEENPIITFEKAIKNVQPLVEVKSKRVGGSNYQVPVEVSTYRATNLSMRWIVQAASNRSGRTIALRLANELLDAANNTGAAVKRRDETHRMAEANKAFAHIKY